MPAGQPAPGPALGRRPLGRSDTGRARAALVLGVSVLCLLLVAGVAVYRFDVLDRWWPKEAPDPRVEPAVIAPPPGLELPDPAAAPSVASAVTPQQQGVLRPAAVREALGAALRDRDLGRHVVVDVATVSGTGPTYHSGRPAEFTPASTTKLLTAVAALSALGPDHRFRTIVTRGSGDRVVLVGGGDPYLARRPAAPAEPEQDQPRRADLRTLARQVAASLREQDRSTVRVGYDATLFTGSVDNPRWERSYLPEGVVSPITALWVDQGRDDSGYGRVEDPALAAARAFSDALRAEGIAVRGQPRPTVSAPGRPELGRVSSAPLSQVIERLVDISDNEAAEVVARHVGLEVVRDSSFAGAARGIRRELSSLGAPVQGSRWYDGSGLSRENRLSGELLLEVLRLASAPERPELRAAITGLPVAGFTGSLTGRFSDGQRAALGMVRAKTGTLVEGGVHGLAGYVTDANGTPLLFVAVADRVAVEKSMDAREAVDRIAAELAACSCSRS